MTAKDIEVAVAHWADYRTNLVVPNVAWGMGLRYEADIIVLRKSGYGVEVEIKVSKSDLKRDEKKMHAHGGQNYHGPVWIRQTFFAVPPALKDLVKPEFGVLVVDDAGIASQYRDAPINTEAVPLDVKGRLKLARLGCMRIWTLKKRLLQLKEQMHEQERENKSV
jgi:hypothetical protein